MAICVSPTCLSLADIYRKRLKALNEQVSDGEEEAEEDDADGKDDVD